MKCHITFYFSKQVACEFGSKGGAVGFVPSEVRVPTEGGANPFYWLMEQRM